MADRAKLFDETEMGAVTLANRVLMAPLTRNRAQADGTPHELAATYYAQRASAGVIISEATQISPLGKGYLDTPGIYTDDHVAAWKEITDAVHAEGGKIFCQLWHVGRISHSSLLPEGAKPQAPSALRAEARTFTANGFEDVSEPEAMSADDIAAFLKDYKHAAEMAKAAGFDGIEVHAANGYLLDQFLQDGSNTRDDAYGGNIAGRMQLLGEVLDAVIPVWGKDRVGVRLSPLGQANDISDSDPEALFSAVYAMLDKRGLAYLHVMENFPGNEHSAADKALLEELRAHWRGFYMANGGYDAQTGAEAIESGHAHAIAYGRPFIANPDLPARLRQGSALNTPDESTFYGGGVEGYTDYPFLGEQSKAA